jgi:peptidoglycan/xylan/chitin deacetylase (PgdA/CDA1 family)
MIRRVKEMGEKSLATIWALRPPTLANRIIYYHSVHPSFERSLPPAQFEEQVDWLNDHGYSAVTMSEVPQLIASEDARRWVAITFDDGYADNLEYAAPILESRGMSGTVFVIAGMVGEVEPKPSDIGHKLLPGRPMLTRSDLQDLVKAGIEIGSHGYGHRSAVETVRASKQDYLDDLTKSRQLLEDATATAVTSYAYPNGQKGAFNSTTRELLPRAGIQSAATTIWGSVKATSDVLELPRCEISPNDSLQDFVAKMNGMREYRRIYQLLFDRSRAW